MVLQLLRTLHLVDVAGGEALLTEVFVAVEALVYLRVLVLGIAHGLHDESSVQTVVHVDFIGVVLTRQLLSALLAFTKLLSIQGSCLV